MGDTGTGTEPDPLSLLSVEALEDELSSLAARLAASTCRFLLAVAEYDRRRAWETWECHDMASWLSWKCGISPVTAREQVRVARSLESLVVVKERFLAGTLSYSQVRAISRVATPATEEALVDLATVSTAAQLEALTRAYRRTREASKDTEQRRYRSRYLHVHYDDDGAVVGSFRLPPETGSVLEASVRRLVDQQRLEALCAEEADGSAGTYDAYAAACADALLELVGAGAAHLAEPDPDGDDRRYLVTVLVDAETLGEDGGGGEQGGAGQGGSGQGGAAQVDAGEQETAGDDSEPGGAEQGGATAHDPAATEPGIFEEPGLCQIEGGPGLCKETARRVACDSAVVTVTEDATGGLLDLGRRTRRPNRALRRALRHRDGHCQFPGCTYTRTEAHHIVHWIDGGATALSNLVSLCGYHHHRLHEGGYRVVRERTGGLCFVRRDGRVLPEVAVLGPTDDRPEPEVEGYHCDWDGSPMPYGDVIEGLLWDEGLLHGAWPHQGDEPGQGVWSGQGDEPGQDDGLLPDDELLQGGGLLQGEESLQGDGLVWDDGPGRDSAEASPQAATSAGLIPRDHRQATARNATPRRHSSRRDSDPCHGDCDDCDR